ncbi:MAG: hypothetical protein GY702_12090 [Desulfobulbaceae bacterium]|nr:hypothetical protein [Desulfobulbaceae bacterium]
MDKTQTLKQMMQTNKMAFDYNFSMMMATYEQNKLLLHTFLSQSDEIPQEVVSSVETWLQAYRKGCEDLKKLTDEGYQSVEKHMSSSDK